jgi:hypothetical protein
VKFKNQEAQIIESKKKLFRTCSVHRGSHFQLAKQLEMILLYIFLQPQVQGHPGFAGSTYDLTFSPGGGMTFDNSMLFAAMMSMQVADTRLPNPLSTTFLLIPSIPYHLIIFTFFQK